MHPKLFSGWVLLAPFLSVVTANSNQVVLVPQRDDASREDGGIFKHPQGEEPTFERIGTIYQHLANDDRYQLITKALNFVEDIGALLNDSSAQLTFFAPPDEVLRPPPGAPPPRNISSFITTPEFLEADDSALLAHVSRYRDLSDLVPVLEEFDASGRSNAAGDEEDDKRKRIFKIILRAILSYHILPEAYSLADLGRNVTYPTKLQIHGALDGQPQRLRVTQSIVAHAYFVNFFTRIAHGDIKTSNGIIHVVNHAILPPPSVFQELYLIPRVFSTLTSALQRSELTGDVDLRYIHGKGLEGTPLVTVFAPTNRAFEALPRRLQLFLFSPFGEKALKKLLQYHIVPKTVIHSNYIHGEAVSNAVYMGEQAEFEHPPHHNRAQLPHHGKFVFDVNLTLSTLFENHTVNARIVQKEFSFPSFPGHHKGSIFKTKVLANDRPAIVPDVISLNGAIHVVDRILDPRSSHHRHHKHHGHHGHHGHHERSGAVYLHQYRSEYSSAFDTVFGGAGEAPFNSHCSSRVDHGRGGSPRRQEDGQHGRHAEPEVGGQACGCAEEGHRHGRVEWQRWRKGERDDSYEHIPPPSAPCQCAETRRGRILPVEYPPPSPRSPSFADIYRVGHVGLDHDDSWADWESWFPQWAEQA